MTPEEKANKLIEKFTPYVWSGASLIGIEEVEMMRDNPRECALICVEEILKTFFVPTQDGVKRYWEKVKQHLQSKKEV